MDRRYVTAFVEVHSPTSHHVEGVFTDMLNKYAEAGFRFCYAINCGGGKYLMIFERVSV